MLILTSEDELKAMFSKQRGYMVIDERAAKAGRHKFHDMDDIRGSPSLRSKHEEPLCLVKLGIKSTSSKMCCRDSSLKRSLNRNSISYNTIVSTIYLLHILKTVVCICF